MNSNLRSRPTQKSERTRQRILDAACGLFNEQGTAPVTTNHIAAAAGLSPGNLYYHYADKQAIIRALFARYAAAYEGRWRPAADAVHDLGALRDNVTAGMALTWEYRFLAREMLALLRADPELRAAYREIYERRLGEWHAFGDRLAAQGLVRPPKPPRTLRDLNVAVWLVAEGWLPFLDATGDPFDASQVERGVDLVLVVLESHLTAKGRRAFARAGGPSGNKEGANQR
jgi:AcrR family transcriptional regulator